MNRSEFMPLMGILISSFTNAKRSPETLEVYWLQCQEIPADTFKRAVFTCCRQNTFMPSVGDILCMCEGSLTHERSIEREKAYRQMKARDSYAQESDLVGFEPRKLISLEDCNRLGGEKPKGIETSKPSGRPVAGHPEFEDEDDDPPLTPEQAQEHIEKIQRSLGGVGKKGEA